MSDARRRQQTGQHAGAVPDAELPAKDRQHAHRSSGRSHQSFSDSRRGEAERLRPGRPETGQAAVQAPELDLREDPFEGAPANRRLAPWNEKSRWRSAKDGERDLRRRTARFERDDGPDGSRQCLGSGRSAACARTLPRALPRGLDRTRAAPANTIGAAPMNPFSRAIIARPASPSHSLGGRPESATTATAAPATRVRSLVLSTRVESFDGSGLLNVQRLARGDRSVLVDDEHAPDSPPARAREPSRRRAPRRRRCRWWPWIGGLS